MGVIRVLSRLIRYAYEEFSLPGTILNVPWVVIIRKQALIHKHVYHSSFMMCLNEIKMFSKEYYANF